MFIRKHVAMFIKSALVFLVFSVSTNQSTALALNDSEDRTLKLDNLGLRVVFNSSFEESHPSTSRWKNKICENFFKHLKVDQGPWGFGLFQTKAGCKISRQGPEPATDPLVWTLNVALNEQQQGFITLCRPYAGNSEKCEASVTIPASRYLPELLSNDSYARLLAAALLDQMPFRSKLTPHLLGNDGSISPKDEAKLESEFPIPPFPSKTTLLPVSAEISTRQSKFRVELKTEPPATLVSQPNIWLVSHVRGSMGTAFSARISDATETLGVRLLEMTDLDSKAHSIFGRNARRQAKANRFFRDRVESIVETRFGGTFKNSKDNAMSADVELLLTEYVFKNLWLGVSWVLGNYRYKVESNFKVPEPSTERSATRSLLIASIGAGMRWSSHLDHRCFSFQDWSSVVWR